MACTTMALRSSTTLLPTCYTEGHRAQCLPPRAEVAAARRRTVIRGRLSLRAEHDEQEECGNIQSGRVTPQTPPPVPSKETVLMSVAPVPIYAVAAAEGLRQTLEPVGELVRSWDLPDWLIHWGHPGNMAVVLLAMGGYGTYLGWQIKLAETEEARAMARAAHPKLMAGTFFFFAVGATGGLTSLVTAGRPILDSPHAYTGMLGLALLTAQTVLAGNFKGNSSLRPVHAYLGSATMALFAVHAVLGLRLGLSF